MRAIYRSQSKLETRLLLSIYGYCHYQDTAGQEIYHALSTLYYRESDIAIIVYDLTDIESFKRVRNWVEQLNN